MAMSSVGTATLSAVGNGRLKEKNAGKLQAGDFVTRPAKQSEADDSEELVPRLRGPKQQLFECVLDGNRRRLVSALYALQFSWKAC